MEYTFLVSQDASSATFLYFPVWHSFFSFQTQFNLVEQVSTVSDMSKPGNQQDSSNCILCVPNNNDKFHLKDFETLFVHLTQQQIKCSAVYNNVLSCVTHCETSTG